MSVLPGSQTSGVDGSSEGGRVNSISVPGTITLYGVELVRHLRQIGYKGKLAADAALVNGAWRLELSYDGETPEVPAVWQGHPVTVKKIG